MTMVAVCTDSVPPAEGATFTACTATVWTDSSNVVNGIFDGLTADSATAVAAAMLTVWGLAFALRMLRKQLEAA